MHVYTIDSKKVAIFWSPRCGHSSTHKLLRSWGYLHLGLTTQVWKRDLPEYEWVIGGETVHRDLCKQVTADSLKGYTKLVLYRDPWKRFCSFWRWEKKYINRLPADLTPEQFIANYDHTRQEEDVEHHSMPQWSQASCLLDGTEEYFNLTDFDSFAGRLATLTDNTYVPVSGIRADTWWHVEEKEQLVKPPNFLDLYGEDVNEYNKRIIG